MTTKPRKGKTSGPISTPVNTAPQAPRNGRTAADPAAEPAPEPKPPRRARKAPAIPPATGEAALALLTPLRRARARVVLDILLQEGNATAEYVRRRATFRDVLRAPCEMALNDLARAEIVRLEAKPFGVYVRLLEAGAAGAEVQA